ncbi:uncharacterized protein LODBEIA_P45660 [Lodderomyces beijingensis]|uniref:Uncharacterized protein n=1 Tax=Lodderomyces beijingensis TaxID=1775926 RepID=A0ABP0ZSL8_9ASCO
MIGDFKLITKVFVFYMALGFASCKEPHTNITSGGEAVVAQHNRNLKNVPPRTPTIMGLSLVEILDNGVPVAFPNRTVELKAKVSPARETGKPTGALVSIGEQTSVHPSTASTTPSPLTNTENAPNPSPSPPPIPPPSPTFHQEVPQGAQEAAAMKLHIDISKSGRKDEDQESESDNSDSEDEIRAFDEIRRLERAIINLKKDMDTQQHNFRKQVDKLQRKQKSQVRMKIVPEVAPAQIPEKVSILPVEPTSSVAAESPEEKVKGKDVLNRKNPPHSVYISPQFQNHPRTQVKGEVHYNKPKIPWDAVGPTNSANQAPQLTTDYYLAEDAKTNPVKDDAPSYSVDAGTPLQTNLATEFEDVISEEEVNDSDQSEGSGRDEEEATYYASGDDSGDEGGDESQSPSNSLKPLDPLDPTNNLIAAPSFDVTPVHNIADKPRYSQDPAYPSRRVYNYPDSIKHVPKELAQNPDLSKPWDNGESDPSHDKFGEAIEAKYERKKKFSNFDPMHPQRPDIDFNVFELNPELFYNAGIGLKSRLSVMTWICIEALFVVYFFN